MMRKISIQRIRFLTALIIAFVVVLAARLYHIQIIQGDNFKAQAESQYVHTVRELYNRGSIFFSTKDGEKVSSATIQSGFLLAIDPTKITNPEHTYAQLRAIIDLDHDDFILRTKKHDRSYVEVAKQVAVEDAEKIDALKLSGVKLYRNQWRYYPGDSLSARTIGFVGYQGDDLVGKYGLERYYEDTLTRDDERLFVNFFAEIFSNVGHLVFDQSSEAHGDVVTTIEPTVARSLDGILGEVHTQYESTVTGGIIIDPKTGDIYALSTIPTFDLNNHPDVDIGEFRNPLVENRYELGSIIKPLTIAAGLDAGAITPASTYYDAGYVELNGKTFSNYDGKGRGTVSMQEVLNQSLNTGVAHVVKHMGKERFKEYFLKLKLGSETGIDLPGEIPGNVRNLSVTRDLEYAQASFGQGIALTPIAAVRALSALANGGVLIDPHIAKRIEYENGKVRDVGFPPGERVFSEQTSETITRMLVTVVDKALKGGTVSKEHYMIAAKTGTAQIADNVNGGYYEDKFLHSFFGYFPAYDPRFLIFLYTVEPKGVKYASETLTDPFMELAQFLINYYDIAPDR